MNLIRQQGRGLGLYWQGEESSLFFKENEIRQAFKQDQKLFIVKTGQGIALAQGGRLHSSEGLELLALSPPLQAGDLGDPGFLALHGVQAPYFAGSMANGISSVEMVIALGQAGFLASYGAAGQLPKVIQEAIDAIQAALPKGPYCFNLIHSPNEPALEQEAVNLYLAKGVTCIEASAYLDLTPALVHYRLAGIYLDEAGQVQSSNRIIAKISRKEVATRFMEPAPERWVTLLQEQGKITAEQARLSQKLPMAEDITVEADSGGHTDNRPLVSLLPAILSLREEIQSQRQYPQRIRVGAGGGIGTPEAALAAFSMGAAYIVTGSINQACMESGTCAAVRQLLAQADMADVMMAPASDMFEQGVKLQVLKRGTLFPMRAGKLWEIYNSYASIEQIPATEREKLERQIFQRPLKEVWQECLTFFQERDPATIAKAQGNDKRKMALIFRWYLGLSSRWANGGIKKREMDYQIWCGPAMGAFNDWTRGTEFATPEGRKVAMVAQALLNSTLYLARLQVLRLQGVQFASSLHNIKPNSLWTSAR